jgi:hypothetical protein
MKLFPADWPGFLDDLVRWGELSIDGRRAFLDGIAPGLSIDPAAGGAAVAELRDVELLAPSGRGALLGLAEGSAAFHQVLKSLQKFPLFESPGLALLSAYLAEHYTQQERSQLDESLALLPNDLPRIAGFVSSVEWLQAALGRSPRADLRRPGTEAASAGSAAARALLGFFTEQRDHIPLRDLEEYFPGIPRDELCAGVRLGVQRCLFYLGLRRIDLEPLVGIWPAAARRLRRLSVVLAPEPVSVGPVFRHPFLVEDMTSLLAAARTSPIPLRRGDDKPFARFVEATTSMLLTLPDWLETLTGLSLESRVGLALQALRLAGLLGPSEGSAGGAGSAAPLAPGTETDAWMRRTVEERRDLVVTRLGTRLFDLLEEDWASREESQAELLPWLQQAFSFVPATTFIRFADFAEYQAAIGSPLGAPSRAGAGSRPEEAAVPPSEEAMEELWKSFLGIFLGRCLASLGGVEMGLTPDGKPGFRMTDTGRRLLGIPRDVLAQVDAPVPPSGGVPADVPLVVQPNYEIVFLSPAPGVEAELGRFCDRVGREVGVLFRISRQSLQKAGAAGIDAEQVIALLRGRSRSPLPANVVHEIRGWMS